VRAQHDPETSDSINEGQDPNADPKVATVSDKTTATNAAQSH
jgi:hypothetical protein